MPKRVLGFVKSVEKGICVDIIALISGVRFLCVSCGLIRENSTTACLKGKRELKLLLLRSLYDWMAALSSHSFSNMVEFLDLCNFR